MCGIVAIISKNQTAEKIISGLKKLEYRGYDSAGIAMQNLDSFKIIKEQGKIKNLEKKLREESLNNQNYDSNLAIGHTRWATHGIPNKENSHPHASDKICVVHNGIIENYQEIKSFLIKKGKKFISQTDTEVLPHLIEYHLELSLDIKDAMLKTLSEVKGTLALAIMIKGNDDQIFFAKKGSPLILGIGEDENYLASDSFAISDLTNKIIVLEDDEFGFIEKNNYQIFNKNGEKIAKKIKKIDNKQSQSSKEGFDFFMLKEIFEQPKVIEETLQTYVNIDNSSINLSNFPFDISEINKITIIACGTSYFAGLATKYLIEEIAKIEVEVDIASEFRYRNHPFRRDNLMIFISQSGETADTIAALKFAKENQQKILSIVNVADSSMAQLSDVIIRTVAGIEIGVASTKAYVAQIAVLSLLAVKFGEEKKIINHEKKIALIKQISEIPAKINQILAKESIENIKKIAKSLTKYRHLLYIGRGISQITSFEAALKLRELSYIDSQGIAAGELKHGSIALIDKKMPVISLIFNNNLIDKILSNTEEVKARNGKIIMICDSESSILAKKITDKKITIPVINGNIQEAILGVVPTQLIAYYVAFFKGNDVDQPRNLAKSVTVE
jgi:glucosamine--fructose-6-phosphate aminotransferase (isomerizing)